LSNVGHSPAVAVWVYIDPYFTAIGQNIDYLKAQRATCDPLRGKKREPHALGATLFPGQEKLFPEDVFVKPKNATDTFFTGFFVGCIDYQFGFAKGHHQTPILFMVAIDPLECVPVSNLMIEEWIEEADAD
jgi:hypothetical protein